MTLYKGKTYHQFVINYKQVISKIVYTIREAQSFFSLLRMNAHRFNLFSNESFIVSQEQRVQQIRRGLPLKRQFIPPSSQEEG